MTFEFLSKVANSINEFRVLPRLFIITYLWLLVESIFWFMALESPTTEQTALISVMTAVGSVWFNYYVNSGNSK